MNLKEKCTVNKELGRVMKKTFTAIALLVGLTAVPVFAQYDYDSHRFEISPFIGYQIGGRLQVQRGELNIKDDMKYGGSIGMYVRPGMQIELAYVRQDTELLLKEAVFGLETSVSNMSVEYFQIGGLQELRSGRVRPFGLFMLGLTHFNPKEKGRSSEWRLSFGMGAGVKVFASQHLGLRFQGRLLFPYFAEGGGIWCTAPGGCFATLSGRLVVQLDFTGGLIIAF